MIAMALQLLSSRSKLLNEEKRMKSSIWVAIMFALMGFLPTESVCGETLEDMEQAETAHALPQSEFSRENALAEAMHPHSDASHDPASARN